MECASVFIFQVNASESTAVDEALGNQVDEVPASVGAPVLAQWATVNGLGGWRDFIHGVSSIDFLSKR